MSFGSQYFNCYFENVTQIHSYALMCFCSILIVKLILNYQEPIDHRKVSVGQPPAVPVQNSYERGHSWAQACTLALLCGRRAGVQGHRRGQGLGRREQGQGRWGLELGRACRLEASLVYRMLTGN